MSFAKKFKKLCEKVPLLIVWSDHYNNICQNADYIFLKTWLLKHLNITVNDLYWAKNMVIKKSSPKTIKFLLKKMQRIANFLHYLGEF